METDGLFQILKLVPAIHPIEAAKNDLKHYSHDNSVALYMNIHIFYHLLSSFYSNARFHATKFIFLSVRIIVLLYNMREYEWLAERLKNAYHND